MSSSDHNERLLDEIKSINPGKSERTNGTNHISIHESLELIVFKGFEKKLLESLLSKVIDKIRVPWRSFQDAMEFVHSLNIKFKTEW